MDKSLNYRRDNRTVDEFKSDIFFRTAKEKFLMELFVKEYEYRNKLFYERADVRVNGVELYLYKDNKIRIENNGICNDGKLVKKSNCDADYIMILYGKHKRKYTRKIDIKNGPVGNKLTFKTYNLKKYVEQKAWILLFYNTGYIDKDPESINYETTRWGMISPKHIQNMLNDNTEYNEPKFGNKPCIRIFSQEFAKYFTSHKLLCKE